MQSTVHLYGIYQCEKYKMGGTTDIFIFVITGICLLQKNNLAGKPPAITRRHYLCLFIGETSAEVPCCIYSSSLPPSVAPGTDFFLQLLKSLCK